MKRVYITGLGYLEFRDINLGEKEARRRMEHLPSIEGRIRDYFAEKGINVNTVRVIGSTAEGLCKPDSDIDVLVTLDFGVLRRGMRSHMSELDASCSKAVPYRVQVHFSPY